MPVRRIPPSYRSITGRLAGLKSVGPAHYESALERDFLITLEADPDVLSYEIQPLRLSYQDAQGRARTYTPDVLVTRRGGLVDLCEVKYVADIRDLRAEHRDRWVAAWRHAQEQGWRFRMITEHHARTPRTRNWLFLSTYRGMTFPPALITELLEVVGSQGPLTLSEWLASCPGDDRLPAMWHLLCTGQVDVDLDQPLSLSSVARLVTHEDTHA